MRLLSCLVLVAGCANSPGTARYAGTAPSPLPPAAEPVPREDVRVEMRALPWWTVADGGNYFVLGFDHTETPPTTGARLGEVRSRDVALTPDQLIAVRCAWSIVPMGDPRPCGTLARTEAMEIARSAIDDARAQLRASAGGAGADVVTDTRCFAGGRERFRLWCEGVAVVAAPAHDGPPPTDPAAPIDHDPRAAETRLLLLADASVGMVRDRLLVGATLGVRYRPFEIAFYFLDLQRETAAPEQGGLVGLGGTALGRFALAQTRFDAIAGVSALAVATNGSTNPDFDGLYHGFGGIAYQTPWKIAGVAQPFVQLRVGAAIGAAIGATPGASTESELAPMFEVHIGMSTPERR